MSFNRTIIAILIIIGAVFAASYPPALAVIAGSNHDFTATGGHPITGVTEICKPCHVPHRPMQNVPLWARALSSMTYTLYNQNAEYSSGNGGAYDASPAALTGTKSRACMSCHDGSLAVAGSDFITTASSNWILYDGGAPVTTSAGMKGSHPIAVNYVTVQTAHSSDYVAPGSLNAAVRLENNKVQCSSCHNAHNKFPKMLTMSNAGSALCLACHIK